MDIIPRHYWKPRKQVKINAFHLHASLFYFENVPTLYNLNIHETLPVKSDTLKINSFCEQF